MNDNLKSLIFNFIRFIIQQIVPIFIHFIIPNRFTFELILRFFLHLLALNLTFFIF